MTFANLIFLFGMLAVFGPLLAHLWAKPRYRRVPFTMIRFLQAGQAKKRSQQNLMNFLVLLLRCVIIALIAMLFARPRLLTQAPPIKNTTVCYLALDDSLSMAYRDGGSSYFDTMVERTQKYIASAPAGCSFNIYAMASGKRLTAGQKYEAELFLNKLRVHPGQADLTEFLDGIQKARMGNNRPEKIYAFLASDFTPPMMEHLSRAKLAAAVDDFRFEPVRTTHNVENMAIINASAVWETDGQLLINTGVVNYGQTKQRNRLTVYIEGQKLGDISIELTAGQQRTFTLDVSTIADRFNQWLPVKLQLEKTDGLSEDNSFYLSIRIPEQNHFRIVLVGNNSREMFLLKTALKTLDSEETLSVRSVLFSQFHDSDLSGADIVMFTGLNSKLKKITSSLQTFVRKGGKVVYFVKECSAAVAETLFKAGILAVRPKHFQDHAVSLEAVPSADHFSLDSELAVGTLQCYKMDRILFSGYFDSQPSSDGVCVWRFQNQAGFIYVKPYGKGVTVFVNTSIDDTLGKLMKSPVAVPFCRYLLGPETRLEDNTVQICEPILFPCNEAEIGVLTPGGTTLKAVRSQSSAVLSYSEETGFFRTVDDPVCYAGVNPIAGETNMARTDGKLLESMLKQRFPIATGQEPATTTLVDGKQHKSIWTYFAWIIIVLITAEAFITNRMQR